MSEYSALSREELIAVLVSLTERIAYLEAENEQLRKNPPPGTPRALPAFVKPNVPKREAGPRKKREHGSSRKLMKPTRVVEHVVSECPDCGRALANGTLHRVREVIDLPPVTVEVTHHHIIARRCGVCCKRHIPQLNLEGSVMGNRRFGVRLMGLISLMRHVYRLPIRSIQSSLHAQYGLSMSVGEIDDVCDAVAARGRGLYDQLRDEIRASANVHADETGWRIAGRNGWLWTFSTETIRFLVHRMSRGSCVPKEVLGDGFEGVLSSDFYSAYMYYLGEHQFCWVHLLRDLKHLKEAYPDDKGVADWVLEIRAIYERAKQYKTNRPRERPRMRAQLQAELIAVAMPYAKTKTPQAKLANRIIRYEPGMFTFIKHPDIPSDNNAAERSLRPSVIARKISGGSRTPAGSETRSILASLFGTWAVRNLNPLTECVRMLASNP